VAVQASNPPFRDTVDYSLTELNYVADNPRNADSSKI
jgi:hypothetical protein